MLAIALDGQPVQLLDRVTGRLRQLEGTTGSRALDWNNDGTLLAVGDYANTIQIWSEQGTLLKVIGKGDNKSYLSIEWHPAKNILLTGSDQIRIFDTAGTLLHRIRHRPEETPVLAVRWHPGGTFFATGDYGEPENGIASLLQFWNSEGEAIKRMEGSRGEYRNLRWNQTGDLLATASDALRLWSVAGTVVSSGKSESLLWGIDWNPAGDTILTGSQQGAISVWTSKAARVRQVAW
jgi:WD40 repeat protein